MFTDTDAPLRRTAILDDKATLEDARTCVLGARLRWHAFPASPLMTLGCPAYRFSGTREDYVERVEQSNAWLMENVGKLYALVLSALSDMLGERVHLLYEVAHPGFHILSFAEYPDYQPGEPHRDAPFQRVPWLDAGAIDPGDNLSFVLPLQLPREPCGLEVFVPSDGSDCTYADRDRKYRSQMIPYHAGHLLLFSGGGLHRLSAAQGDETELRMTMQGHILRLNDALIAYW